MFVAEAAAAEFVASCCGGAVLVGWALHLQMPTAWIIALSSLPVACQTLQMPAAFATARFGHRRSVLVATAVSRAAFIPLVALPWLPLSQHDERAVLVVAAVVHYAFAAVSVPAWNDWMACFVPPRRRGRFLGLRARASTFVGALVTLAAGFALDRAGHAEGATLQILALFATVGGAIHVALVAHQPTRPATRNDSRLAIAGVLGAADRSRAQGALLLIATWHAACGLSAPFFGLYVVRELHAAYGVLAAYCATFALGRVATTAHWGAMVDRLGADRVLVACTAGLCASPVLWAMCTPQHLWPLGVDALVGGVLFGGHTVASSALPFVEAPVRGRLFHLAAIAAAGGAAFAASAGLGALALHAVPDDSLRPLLIGSTGLRVVALACALVHVCRRRSDGQARGQPSPQDESVPRARAAA